MKTSQEKKRHIVCSLCGRESTTLLKERDICYSCYRKEPKTRCQRCGQPRHVVGAVKETGLCERCRLLATRPTGTCARCGMMAVICNEEVWLCEVCSEHWYHAQWYERRKKEQQTLVPCSVCGKDCLPKRVSRAICETCWLKERNGERICSGCQKPKVMYTKAKGLCAQCALEQAAPKRLRAYIDGFTSPDPYTVVLFRTLASTILWETVDRGTNQQFRVFGRFLQSHPFAEPLTWEAIEQALPDPGQPGINPNLIRESLLRLGHTLAAKGLLESRDAFLARRTPHLLIEQAPASLQPVLQKYLTWLCERKTLPATIKEHLAIVVAFWSYCEQKGITALTEIQSEQVKSYLLTLYWQWQCQTCQGVLPFDPQQRRAPKGCSHCQAVGSLTQVRRYVQGTISNYRGTLRVFFDWARINRLVITNPVHRESARSLYTIRHYPLDIIQKLCTILVNPDADPMEALILYLILFHGFSIPELQRAEIPVVRTWPYGEYMTTLTETYAVTVPRSVVSVGVQSPRRPEVLVTFPECAASWLKPLLMRFEQQRKLRLKNVQNGYLFLSSSSAHYRRTVSRQFLTKVVRQASQRVVGTSCTPGMLRKTVGVLFADAAGAGILRWMGWEDEQAFRYSWAQREVVQPLQYNAKPIRQGEEETAKFPPPQT